MLTLAFAVKQPGSYLDYTGNSTSNKSDANMEHSDSQGSSNDTIKITPQFAHHFKPKVRPLFTVLKHFAIKLSSGYSYCSHISKSVTKTSSLGA